ncbi:PAS domain-containing protein [Kiloniella sp. EL199]|uniref:PAS domain-containing protein n=1 Tax=Kiloniella sp. EL199 TaxID=2107581 RepID=UPI0020B125F0|nr:PAS domain-containing protein [Kiloniella sp. EL199]
MKIRNARNRQFYDYWRGLERKENSVLPNRSSFRPEDIPSLLPNIIVYELISRENIQIRLQGTAIDERFGQNLTGRNYLDYVADERRSTASDAFWLMALQPCGVVVVLEHTLSSGRLTAVEAVGFPFNNDAPTLDGSKPNPLIIYQSNEIDNIDFQKDRDEERLKLIRVVERNMIDIGRGEPVFVD